MEVDDPYRALEQDSELTRDWIAAQNARTERALERHRDASVEARLRQLLSIGVLSDPQYGGDRLFVLEREGQREQPALFELHEDGTRSAALIDPEVQGERAALDYYYAAPDGRHVAFGISEAGDERAVLRVLELSSGRLLPEVIDHAKWCALSWLPDGSGFYYTRYPRAGEAGHDPQKPDAYFPRLFFHRLGDDPARDPLLFQSATATDFPYAAVGDGGRFVSVMNHRGWTASDLYLFDRGAEASARVAVPDHAHPLEPVVVGRDAEVRGVVHRGYLYMVSNEGAPRRRILRVEVAKVGDPQAFEEVVTHGEGTIEDFAVAGDRLVVHRVRNMRSELMLYALDGSAGRALALPTDGSIAALDAETQGGRVAVVFSSFFHPPSVLVLESGAQALSARAQVHHDLDLEAFQLSEAWVRSRDGTRVHLYYVHRRSIEASGQHPVLLYGYGGFDVSLLPSFTRTALHWIERGGIYAVANLRGGGELGDGWHRAGMLEHKPRVFEDFEAAIEYFTDSGLSRPERIAITGASNGGLLVGAMVTRVPTRFAAAAAYVGLYDMLRYHLFPPAEIWVSEYGDPREPEAARYLHAYSPYHRVVDGGRYPSVLIETADHDTRVSFAHSTKFAARLQHAQAGPQPIYFHMTRSQGHGKGTRLSDLVEKYARQHAFLEQALNVR